MNSFLKCLIHKIQYFASFQFISGIFKFLSHANSKQLFPVHLFYACTKTSDIVVIRTMTSAPGVKVRIAFLICYLQSLYEIELDHYFCSEFVRHVTNQNILVDAETPMATRCMRMEIIFTNFEWQLEEIWASKFVTTSSK